MGLSAWLGFACLGGLVTGQVNLLLRLRGVGGGARSIVGAISVERIYWCVIVLIDSITALLLATAFGLLAPTAKPLVDLFANAPALGWFIVGSFGPAIAERGYSGSLVRGHLSRYLGALADESDELAATSWRLRNEAVDGIRRALWKGMRRGVREEFVRLRGCIEAKIVVGEVDADRFISDADDFIRLFGRGVPNGEVETARQELPPYSDRSLVDVSHRNRVVALAVALLREERWDVVEQYCPKPRRPSRGQGARRERNSAES